MQYCWAGGKKGLWPFLNWFLVTLLARQSWVVVRLIHVVNHFSNQSTHQMNPYEVLCLIREFECPFNLTLKKSWCAAAIKVQYLYVCSYWNFIKWLERSIVPHAQNISRTAIFQNETLYVVVQFYPWLKFYFALFQTRYQTLPYLRTKER